MKSSSPPRETLEHAYRRRYEEALVPLAQALENFIAEYLKGQERVDRITSRAKGVASFLKKAGASIDGRKKYDEPLEEIQDQIGARIVVFYKSDVDRIDALVKKYFSAIEYKKVIPDSESEFGYFGQHLVLILPKDIVDKDMDKTLVPEFFELQIKTLFQHAWSEADHDLGYKPGDKQLTPEQKRQIAFTSAQSWGADLIFDQLFREREVRKSG